MRLPEPRTCSEANSHEGEISARMHSDCDGCSFRHDWNGSGTATAGLETQPSINGSCG